MSTSELSTITGIEAQVRRPDRRSIFIDGAFALGVHAEVVERSGIHVGQRISLEELRTLTRAEEARAARERALLLLSYRDRSAREIERHLHRKGYEAEVAAEVVADLIERNLVDDARFSKAWVENRAEARALGPNRLAAELRFRGVNAELVREALTGLEPEQELALALRAAKKKLHSLRGEEPRAAMRRMMDFLRRRGFSWEVVRRACEELLPGSEDES